MTAALQMLAPEDSVRGYYAEARQVLSAPEALGVDYGEVTDGEESGE